MYCKAHISRSQTKARASIGPLGRVPAWAVGLVRMDGRINAALRDFVIWLCLCHFFSPQGRESWEHSPGRGRVSSDRRSVEAGYRLFTRSVFQFAGFIKSALIYWSGCVYSFFAGRTVIALKGIVHTQQNVYIIYSVGGDADKRVNESSSPCSHSSSGAVHVYKTVDSKFNNIISLRLCFWCNVHGCSACCCHTGETI